jgi:hypothetical protein
MYSNFANAKNPDTSFEKSGSTGQLQSQFADIGLLLKNIVKDNPPESAFNTLT